MYYNLYMKALIIVDMQNDFSEDGPMAIKGFSDIIKGINSKIKEYSKKGMVIATRDWHPRGHMSFKEWPEHCIENTEGAQLHKKLKVKKIDHILNKGTDIDVDSYSIFKDNEGNLLNEISNILRNHNIIGVEIVGVAGEICVKQTAIDAKELGYEVIVNEELVKYLKNENIPAVRNTYNNLDIEVV